MVLDLIAWMPEVQLCTALLIVLFYGTGPAVLAVNEIWSIPAFAKTRINNRHITATPGAQHQSLTAGAEHQSFIQGFAGNQAQNSVVVSGPSVVTAHLCLWAVIWCFLGALMMFNNPLPALQAGGCFLRDPFSILMSVALLVYAGIAIVVATDWYNCAKVVHQEYAILVCLCIFGMHLLLMTTDLMSLYLCLELQSFSIVVLCSLNYKSAFAVEAGIKYFLLSALSSCLLLLGIGLVYWDTGLTKIPHLQELYQTLRPQWTLSSVLGLWLISLGLLWKLAAAPLHFWAADVYQGAWTSLTLLISTLPKIAVLGFWVHHWQVLWTHAFGNTLVWFRFRSLVIGAIAPLAQVQLKRLIAFSSVGHMGFILMPLVGSSEGYASVWVYLSFYCVTSLVVWGMLLWPLNRQTTKNTTDSTLTIKGEQREGVLALTPVTGAQFVWDLAGLNIAVPTAAVAWTIAMLSLAGLPPVAGFLGKLGLFWWALNAHMYVLVFIALLATLLSRVYYLRIVKVSYIENPTAATDPWQMFSQFSPIAAYCVAASTLILVVGLWYAGPIVVAAHVLTLNLCSEIIATSRKESG